jgi:hypothetical protein
MERGLKLGWNVRCGCRLRMIWLGRKRASRAAFTWVVNQCDVSSRARSEMSREQNTLLLELLLDDTDADVDRWR